MLLVLAGCGGDSGADRQVSPAATSPETQAQMASLMLLQPGEAPEGLSFEQTASGPAPAEWLESELAHPGEKWPPTGFADAFQHVFRMDGNEQAPPDEVRGVINLLITFEDAGSARAFLERSFPPSFELEEAQSFGYRSLGDERRGLRTAATADRPIRTTLMWCRDRWFLQLNVFGAYELEEIMTMANAVDDRAEGLA